MTKDRIDQGPKCLNHFGTRDRDLVIVWSYFIGFPKPGYFCKPVFLSQNTIDSIVHAASLRTCVIICHNPLLPTLLPLPLWRSTTALSITHHPVSASQKRDFACLLITKTYQSYLISHMSVHHFLHHHCHHPLLFLTSTPGSRLIFSTNPFPIVLLTFHPSVSGQSPAAKRILVHFWHKFVPLQVPKWRRISCIFSVFPLGLAFQWARLCRPETSQLKCPSPWSTDV